MKRTIRMSLAAGLCVMLAASALALGEGEKSKAKLGENVPTFKLTGADGQERSLESYKGKVVILEWINPDCPWVQRAYKSGSMQQSYEKIREINPQAVWLAINTTHYTGPEQNEGWAKRYKLKYPILLDLDAKVARAYGAKTTPHMFVIDQEGVLRYHGAIDNNQFGDKSEETRVNYVVNAVEQITNKETVSPDYVKSWGCSVKAKARKY